MADEKDIEKDAPGVLANKPEGKDDVEGHTMAGKTGDEGKKDAPGAKPWNKPDEEDDVEGHGLIYKTGDEGKKDSPSVASY